VIEVARIEKLTKTLGARVLATSEVAGFAPLLWRSIGRHSLEGVGQPQELFGFRGEAAAEAA
jgi:class 3 adenylate cyclase